MASEQSTALSLPVVGKLTYREIHAFEDGLYSGIHEITTHDYTQEKHYWRVGWIIGDMYDQFIRQ